jgi:hypothetical protein
MKRMVIQAAALLSIVACSCITVFAQSTKMIPVSRFNKVTVSSGIDLYLSQGNSESAKLVGAKELIDQVVIQKEGESIRIRFKENFSWRNLFNNKTLAVYLNYKDLQEVSASGGSDVFTQNTLKTSRLTLSASGGSDLKMDVVCKDIEIHSSGGSDVDLKGKATNMALQTSGGSDVDALGFNVDYAKVDASGGSDANVFVNKALQADASGGSDVQFKGDASYQKTSSSKSGSVTRID